MARFFALRRIKPHNPPLVRVPVNSFEFHTCVHTPQPEYLLRSLQHWISPTLSIHRLQRGLLGYLILFAPHAFVPQRQLQPSKPPSPPVFLHISTHFTATHGIPLTPPALKLNSLNCSAGVKPRNFTTNLNSQLHTLYAQSFRTTLATYVLPRLLARS